MSTSMTPDDEWDEAVEDDWDDDGDDAWDDEDDAFRYGLRWDDDCGDDWGDEDDDDRSSTAPEWDPRWGLPRFDPALSLGVNAWVMAYPLWGPLVADSVMGRSLAVETRFPDARGGRRKRGWTAALLLAAASEATGCGADVSALPGVLLDDITSRTGVSRPNLERYWRRLGECGSGFAGRPGR